MTLKILKTLRKESCEDTDFLEPNCSSSTSEGIIISTMAKAIITVSK